MHPCLSYGRFTRAAPGAYASHGGPGEAMDESAALRFQVRQSEVDARIRPGALLRLALSPPAGRDP
jgi:hypothetical protein